MKNVKTVIIAVFAASFLMSVGLAQAAIASTSQKASLASPVNLNPADDLMAVIHGAKVSITPDANDTNRIKISMRDIPPSTTVLLGSPVTKVGTTQTADYFARLAAYHGNSSLADENKLRLGILPTTKLAAANKQAPALYRIETVSFDAGNNSVTLNAVALKTSEGRPRFIATNSFDGNATLLLDANEGVRLLGARVSNGGPSPVGPAAPTETGLMLTNVVKISALAAN